MAEIDNFGTQLPQWIAVGCLGSQSRPRDVEWVFGREQSGAVTQLTPLQNTFTPSRFSA